MSYRDPKVTVEWETRLCEVSGEIGYFHTWEHWANVVGSSILKGGHPAGQVGQVYAIVEFRDGVRRVDPTNVKFLDGINAGLTVMNNRKAEDND